VKNISGTVNSNAATLTVVPAEPTLMSDPEDAQVYEGETAIFTVEVDGNGLTYQWQYSANNGSSWSDTTLIGCHTSSLRVMASAGNNGRYYRCLITDTNGCTVATRAARLILI
jgi:hypothetical protein